MKKLIVVLALAALAAGCAHDQGMGGSTDQNGNNKAPEPKQGMGGNQYDANTNGMNNTAPQ
jgi:hypothetical protein